MNSIAFFFLGGGKGVGYLVPIYVEDNKKEKEITENLQTTVDRVSGGAFFRCQGQVKENTSYRCKDYQQVGEPTQWNLPVKCARVSGKPISYGKISFTYERVISRQGNW